MSDEPDDPVIQSWAAPTFAVPLSGTLQKLPLSVRCNFPINRNGKWKAHIYNPQFKRELTGTHRGYYYEFTVDDLDQGPDCEIHTQFDAQATWSEWAFSGKFRVLNPITLSPPPALVGPDPVISGSGAYPNAGIELYRVPNNRTWRGTASESGSWSVQVDNLEEGTHQFGGVQIVNSLRSDNSALVTITVAKKTVITSPIKDAVLVNDRMPMISGDGHNGTEIRIYEAGSGVVLYGSGTVENNRFNVKLNVALPFRRIVLVAEARTSSQFLRWSNEVPITVVEFGIPVILAPATDAYVTRTPLFEGEGAVGASVIVYRDGTTEVVGRASVGLDKKWSTYASQQLPPGRYTIAAEQTYQNQASGRSDARTFKVRPPELTAVNVTYPSLTTVEFSGTGFTGATVEITIVSGPQGATAPPDVVVSAGTWKTTSQNWPIGTYELTAVQKVWDNVGGYILSQAYRFTASSKLLPPTDITHTVNEYRPTFYGKGIAGASVLVKDKADGTALAPAALVTAQGWSTTANAPWTPGSTRTVLFVQTLGNAESEPVEYTVKIDRYPAPFDLGFSVVDYIPILTGKGINGATVVVTDKVTGAQLAPPATVTSQNWTTRPASPWEPNTTKVVLVVQKNGSLESDPVEMTISVPLVAPQISVIEDDGLSPKISGRCWPGAVLRLTYSDDTTVHEPDGASGNWAFKRPVGFAPDKEHTVTVIQTVAGNASPAASQTFRVSPEKLLITEPAENTEAGRTLLVRGEQGFNGATLQLRDAQFGWALGAPKQLTSQGAWFVELSGLEFRTYQIDATQTIGDRPSARSDVRTFDVVLLPPVIEVPAPGQALPRTAMLSGTGDPYGQVSVWREGVPEPLLDKIPVSAEGQWQAEVVLPVGTYTLKARQFLDNRESKDSPSLTYRVVPAAPFIESPGRDTFVGRSVVVSGFGDPEDTVTASLTNSKGSVLGSAPVLEDRTWTLTLVLSQAAGRYNLQAVSSRDGYESDASVAHPVLLGTYLPGIDEPAAGAWVAGQFELAGTGRAGVGQVVSWYDPGQILSANIAVTAQGWRSQGGQGLRAGGHWCRFQQTVTDGADGSTLSDWVESGRFDKIATPPGAGHE
ncbi:hypothetical protein JFU48_13780 [Pseudomonas sp. TH49]|uniref:hypothetical protein n=1 Tax=Pseudomonas sp. TH49 TaxID=2796413 RepID=UPI00191229A8|nr:hypothetical protein [Pseudomonas sp. TH49]MBK5342452.1 hypothetical protein [Pseudomonas sp. TH49]